MVGLLHGGAQRERLQDDREAEDAERDPCTVDLVRVAHLLNAFVEREEATHTEQHEGDDERPEVALGPVPERVGAVGGTPATLGPEQEQTLVTGVGDAVAGLGEEAGRPGEDEPDELRDGNAKVGEERGDDGLAAAVLHGGHTSDPIANGE